MIRLKNIFFIKQVELISSFLYHMYCVIVIMRRGFNWRIKKWFGLVECVYRDMVMVIPWFGMVW